MLNMIAAYFCPRLAFLLRLINARINDIVPSKAT